MINGWYAGDAPVQNKDYVPPGWSGAQPLYLNVVAKSCRTCHIALGTRDTSLTWSKFQDFINRRDTVIDYICLDKFMPQAKVTFGNFWLSADPNRPTFFQDFRTTGWEPAGPCTP